MLVENEQIFTQSRINLDEKKVKTHKKVIVTKVVGVSFDERQEMISRLQIGDKVWLEFEPENPFDANAIRVTNNKGEKIGYLNARLAKKLAYRYSQFSYPYCGKVYSLTGSSFDHYLLGVVVAFRIPPIRKALSESLRCNQIEE